MANTATLAFEIGTEEIPAFDLKNATVQLETLVPEALDALGIPHGAAAIYSSPRRLIAVVSDVAESTEAVDEVFRGPSAKIAFDDEGKPTKAAIGFARGKGLDVDALERREENGTEYVFATRHVDARPTAELLPDALLSVIDGISWPKSMRWGTTREVFSRPVRWIVALLGDQVVPVAYAGLEAGRLTYGHRYLAPGPHKVADADNLVDTVRGLYVVPSQKEREQRIREGVAAAEKLTGSKAELPAKTLTEVINLSEYPTVMVGSFDEEFLKVPEEIIVDAMLMHQRYFPLYDGDRLTNRFIIVSNGNPDCEATIVDGNERVVAARLYDAKFFYDEDLKKPLESYVDRLDELVFQETLGTVKAKTDRVVRLARHIGERARAAQDERADIERAALLAKADLVTNAVVEFTSVQGIMGSYYALSSGENDRVAQAIADHYRPRFSGDEPPASTVGRVVAMADKLDTVCGLFAVDQAPTGSSDPFALRRAALGILTIMEAGLDVSLADAVDTSLGIYRAHGLDFDYDAVRAKVMEFFITRTRVLLKDEGNGLDAIDAVLAAGVEEPMELVKRVNALETARSVQPETFEDLATAFARANNLRDEQAGTDADVALMEAPEKALDDAIDEAQAKVNTALAANDYAAALGSLASLRGPIDRFFEEVMVMADDPAVRINRLALLNRFAAVFAPVADFGLMAKTK